MKATLSFDSSRKTAAAKKGTTNAALDEALLSLLFSNTQERQFMRKLVSGPEGKDIRYGFHFQSYHSLSEIEEAAIHSG
jgi:hypothetical protein